MDLRGLPGIRQDFVTAASNAVTTVKKSIYPAKIAE
jgi:hypothetical protein